MRPQTSLIAGLLVGLLALQGCVAPQVELPRGTGVAPAAAPKDRNFRAIVNQVEPIAEQLCRETPGSRNCDFLIKLDPRPDPPANAYQTLTTNNRPLLVINQTLINELRNADEIAFVLAHEAAHHISDHIRKQQANAYATALAAGLAAAALGAPTTGISTAQEIGARTGARIYSKDFELEADSMGARIAYYAGYDPVLGVAYFTRAKDPGDVFLGTHPPNGDRIKTVRRTMDALRP